jgi:hydrogenase/urease accessory protein HupE
MNRLVLRIALAAAALCWAAPASAHPVPFSYLDLKLTPQAVDGTLVIHVIDLAHDLKIEPAARLLDPVFAREQGPAITALLASRLGIRANGRPLGGTWTDVEVLADRQAIRVHARYPLAAPAGSVTIDASLFPYDPAHQTFVNIYEGATPTQAMLDPRRTTFEYFPGTRQGIVAVVRKFIPAGVQHILAGPDHILFLVGLLLAGGSVRRLAIIVTGFTVAHSVTLSLAALNIFSPPARFIEPAIALSIVYVGADTLLSRNGRDVRVWIAFAFGFIHGFGFAYVLREMDLPARALGWSLFSFNAGVEIGQLAIVTVVAAALAYIRSHSEVFVRRLVVAGSIVVMAAGASWFVERLVSPGGLQ